MFTQTLQIEKLIATSVFLRDNVIYIDVRLANFFAAFRAGIPAVIRFVVLKPFFTIAQKFFPPPLFAERVENFFATLKIFALKRNDMLSINQPFALDLGN